MRARLIFEPAGENSSHHKADFGQSRKSFVAKRPERALEWFAPFLELKAPSGRSAPESKLPGMTTADTHGAIALQLYSTT